MSIPGLDFIKTLPPWTLLLFGGIAGSLKSIWSTVYDHTVGYVFKKISVSITIEDKRHQSAYDWLSFWVEGHLAKRNVNSLLLAQGNKDSRSTVSIPSRVSAIFGQDDDDDDDDKRTGYRVIPSYGTYYMMWRGRPMVIDHTVENQNALASGKTRLHTLKIHIWFSRSRKMVMELLREAQEQYYVDLPPATEYRTPGQYEGWSMVRIPPRNFDSVYLPDETIERLNQDVETFLSSRQKFEALGIPYRRGYLFDGPPGTGKSTLVQAVAAKFGLKIYSLSLRGPDMTADKLNSLLQSVAKPAILLIEDVDCFSATTVRRADQEAPLSMSDVLNALDGVGASDSRILIMTTNYRESLDPALIRAGRIDEIFHLGYAADAEIKKFYDRVSPLHSLGTWEEFRAKLPTECTIADAQALAFSHEGK